MTGIEKTAIASFLDLSAGYLNGGYAYSREYNFADDPRESECDTANADTRNLNRGVSRSFTEEDKELISNTPCSSMLSEGQRYSVVNNINGDTLEAVAADIAACNKCGLCETRKHVVPGEGAIRPLVMVVGEGPGEDEDNTGRPFVGRAGQLLDRMLDSKGKIGLYRDSNCYIANIVKCRPPGNRNPQNDEIAACVPFLTRQIAILKPKIILAAGNTAAKTLLDSNEGITRLRGHFTVFRGTLLMEGEYNIPLLPTFHPSALLRDESLKAPVWEDLKKLRVKLCELDSAYAKTMAEIPI